MSYLGRRYLQLVPGQGELLPPEGCQKADRLRDPTL